MARAEQEMAVFAPSGGHPASAGLALGSAIVAQPHPRQGRGVDLLRGALYGQAGLATLAGRAVYAWGRLIMRYPTTATKGSFHLHHFERRFLW